ncbi:Succinate/fumarate:quinone oxidoreductase subunit C [Candidatus Cyrtobacter comes]|uniref:Succinate dehydrogenase cytochrome b556 subunit n=1 Tax=Candidatus Cyrtobacter comes TaxID=675776 RepID=A0ABU5L6K2_9RICK|nr:succinate dehydrogenase, cytochrome b556 subunit [Candidatus Cyrtobacter comes]MDZ5761757.1 Succinate/fumarate:quinone oxidoreductase subunit C [Candidatus Cyrtobacter comes]
MRNLKSPISPHLAIYKMQINSFSSIFHRACSVLLCIAFIFGGIWLVAELNTYELSEELCLYNSKCECCGSALFSTLFSVVLSFSFIYYVISTIRHIVWGELMCLSKRCSDLLNWLSLALAVLVFLVLWIYIVF